MKTFFKWLPLILVSVCAPLTIVISHQMTPRVSDSGPALEKLQRAIEHTPVPTLDLSPIKADVAELATLIKHMKNEDEASFNTLLTNTKTELQSKLESIREAITALDEKTHPVKILPSSYLPFKILSIDSLQHISVATVRYGYKTTALEAGDTLAGWLVKRVDFATQTMVFENDEGEVHLSLTTGVAHA